MPMTELIYESDPDDPDWREVASDEESQGDGDKSGEDGDDEEDVVESGDDGEKSEDDVNNAGDDGDNNGRDRDVEPEASRRKAKRKREESEVEEDNEETQRKREKKTNVEEEDDIVERFEFEIEESVATWFDEFRINRNSIPESSDEEEDPIIIRDRRIRMGIDDKLGIGRTFFTAFEIKEAVLHHALKSRENIRQESCTPNGKCKLLKSPVIGKLFMDKLRMDPNYMPLDIQQHIKEQWKLLSSIGQVQRGRLLALKWLREEYAQHFAHLRGYVAELEGSNPGSTSIVDTFRNADGEDVFNRFYVCLGAMKKAFYYCRPIIGIDGTFLKYAVKGCLLTAIAHDSNNQIYPIAWAAVQTENADNWLWFLKLLKADLDLKDGNNYVIISDRSKGIISSVKNELPNAEHRMCVKHIVDNLKGRHANKDLLKGLVWHLAWSYNDVDFKANLKKIRAYDLELYDDVMKEDPKSWSRAYYKIGSCCEDVDNNATESFNSTIVKARAKALVPMLETIRRQAMRRITKRNLKIEKWKKKLSEYASDILEEEKEDAMRCELTKGTHGKYEVHLDGNSHYVDLTLGKWECSCGKWQITGIPCEHAYAAILDVNKDVDDYASPYFSTQVWKEVYEKGPEPVRGPRFWMTNNYVLITKPEDPNLPGRKKGQKKKYDRIKGKNESPKKKKKGNQDGQETGILKLGRKGRIMHCRKCGEAGHNSAGCPKFPKEKKTKKEKESEKSKKGKKSEKSEKSKKGKKSETSKKSKKSKKTKANDEGKTLNKEQEEVLRSKPAVFVLIEELEKIRAPLSAAVAEEIILATQQYPQIDF
ncbi:Zinc finger SWIM-type [Arabidopsis suecica]|uniref:Zinc finger SWIM-type n=1 Tax=Arabidopsis suecica TaxID=45249 RepID=A0A8T1ZW91_ARASU|nr:Zinc finger SWIM-type [Arabidopsis suecica]